jgi:Fuseless
MYVGYLLDDHLFPDNAEHSALASLGLGTAGMMASQGMIGRIEQMAANHAKKMLSPAHLKVLRFGALYSVAVSCVLVWRGTWVGWDCLYERSHAHSTRSSNRTLVEDGAAATTANIIVARATDPGHATRSGMLSHVVAVTLLLGTGLFASVLAPPAAISVIRDWTVKSGSSAAAAAATASSGRSGRASSAYTAPAQSLVQQLFGGSSSSSTASVARYTSSSRGASSRLMHHNAPFRRLQMPALKKRR